MLAKLSVHASRNKDLRTVQRIFTTPEVPLYDYVDGFGNICTRLTMPTGGITISCGFVIEDRFEPDEVDLGARQASLAELPDDVLHFLLASRYCETDKLTDIAWACLAICQWAGVWCRLLSIMSTMQSFRLYGCPPDQDRMGGVPRKNGRVSGLCPSCSALCAA
jgi:hypothetical protein